MQIVDSITYKETNEKEVVFAIQKESANSNIIFFDKFQKQGESKCIFSGQVLIDKNAFKHDYLDFSYLKSKENAIQI